MGLKGSKLYRDVFVMKYLISITFLLVQYSNLSRDVRKRSFGHVRPPKIQISLCIHDQKGTGCHFWITKDAKFLLADNEDPDQIVGIRRLISKSSFGKHVRRYVSDVAGTVLFFYGVWRMNFNPVPKMLKFTHTPNYTTCTIFIAHVGLCSWIFNFYRSRSTFSRRQIDRIFLLCLENRLWHFMQIVS